ncbi:unnamed protein product [Paramecium pentaurelia]|uniref:Protein kinase domain-containing protein n=1 Tax=Paramecium pentaurelia TaxID=43138 RepID=A0A8S1W3H3_9CILI|nr:unnamed protein product [Paramecium pentaurelia]
MEIIDTFQCLISFQDQDNYSHKANLQFTTTKINLILNTQCFEIEISYKLQLKWKCEENKLISMHFQQFTIQAGNEDLLKFKKHLDCQTTYIGIREIYDNVILIQQKDNAKICSLKSKLDGKMYICKCYKKQEVEKYKIYEQLVILRKLGDFKNVAQIIDFYESSNSYYFIFEQMNRIHYSSLSHEDIQSMMFVYSILYQDILCCVKMLILNHVFHSQINLSNIVIDNDMNCKLAGFEHAELLNEKNAIYNSLMLTMVGHIMIKLYQINNLYRYQYNSKNKQQIFIPDYGNSLVQGLLETDLNQQINIEQALSHEYFEYFDYNSSPMMQQQIVPKLKSFITQQSLSLPIESNI